MPKPNIKIPNKKLSTKQIAIIVTIVVIIAFLGINAADSKTSSSYSSSIRDEYGIAADMGASNSYKGGLNIGSMMFESASSASSSTNYDSYDSDYNTNTVSGETTSLDDYFSEEKLSYKANLSIETKSFDKDVEALKQKLSEYNGVIQNERYYNNQPSYNTDRYISLKSGYKEVSLEVRVPTSNYNTVMSEFNSIGRITSSTSTVENISRQYYDTQAQLKAYETELEKLMDMYNYSSTISDMIEINDRITSVNTEINRLKTVIHTYDMDVAYSTITIRMREVETYTIADTDIDTSTFLGRVIYRFRQSFVNMVQFVEDLILFIIDAMYAIAVLVVIIILFKKYLNNREAKKIQKKIDMYKALNKNKKNTNNIKELETEGNNEEAENKE